MSTSPTLASVLAGVIRQHGEGASLLTQWPEAIVVAEAEREGVAGLVADALAGRDVSPALQRAISASAGALAVVEALREPELRQLVATFADRGIRALVFKGAQVAYLCYARPELRPRLDSDLLVSSSDQQKASETLLALGYEAVPQFEGAYVTHQRTFVKRRHGHVVHVVDLHWRISNPEQFGRLLAWEEVNATAIPLPSLGGAAAGLSAAHALYVSLTHPVAHHQNAARLVWDYDTALLAAGACDADWDRLARFSASHPFVAAIFAVRLQRAVELFDAPVPPAFLERCTRESRESDRERLAMCGGERQLASALSSLRAFPRWTDRIQFVREHAFPPASYMRDVYAPESRAPLAFLYAKRALAGARKWMVRPVTSVE